MQSRSSDMSDQSTWYTSLKSEVDMPTAVFLTSVIISRPLYLQTCVFFVVGCLSFYVPGSALYSFLSWAVQFQPLSILQAYSGAELTFRGLKFNVNNI
jgi:hypothetical protein